MTAPGPGTQAAGPSGAPMRLARLGVTPVKGTAHLHPDLLALDRAGPRFDRRFCLVDPAAGRVVKTVEAPVTLGWTAEFDGRTLTIAFPDGDVVRDEVGDGEALTAEYWGRRPTLVTVPGPWSPACSRRLGRRVVLARAQEPGAVVYGAAVTLVTTASLHEVARRLGRAGDLLDDAERWRATAVVDTAGAAPFVEDGWLGRDVDLGGGVVVRPTRHVARCAVVRRRPRRGDRDPVDPLAALAPDRRRDGEVVFGLEADVVAPGVLRVGAPVTVGAAAA